MYELVNISLGLGSSKTYAPKNMTEKFYSHISRLLHHGINSVRAWIGIRLDNIVDEKSPTTKGSSSDPFGSRDFGKPLHSTPSTV